MRSSIIKSLEVSGSVGLTEKEISKETGLTITYVKKLLKELKNSELIYKNYTEMRWRLIKYRRKDEIPYNEQMRFCAG